jgi:hypothetical protein
MESKQHGGNVWTPGKPIRWAIFALVAVALAASTALAQDRLQDRTQSKDQLHDQIHDQDRTHDGIGDQAGSGDAEAAADQDRDQLRQRLHDRIQDCPATAEQKREMTRNLDEGLRLRLDGQTLETLYPENGKRGKAEEAGLLLKFQRHVLGAAAEGLPAEALAAKIREGRMKGVPAEALAGAVEKLQQQLRTSERIMERADKSGVEIPSDPAQRRQQVRELSRTLAQGLDEPSLDQLRQRACDRARDGSCRTGVLVAAAGAAARLHESGIETGRAVRIAGDALRSGYDAAQMNRIGLMTMAAHQRRNGDELANELENCLRNGMAWREMERHLMQAGWLGPADMGGHGGDPDHMAGPGGMGGGGQGGGMGGGGMGGSGNQDGTGGGTGGSGSGGSGAGGH